MVFVPETCRQAVPCRNLSSNRGVRLWTVKCGHIPVIIVTGKEPQVPQGSLVGEELTGKSRQTSWRKCQMNQRRKCQMNQTERRDGCGQNCMDKIYVPLTGGLCVELREPSMAGAVETAEV